MGTANHVGAGDGLREEPLIGLEFLPARQLPGRQVAYFFSMKSTKEIHEYLNLKYK